MCIVCMKTITQMMINNRLNKSLVLYTVIKVMVAKLNNEKHHMKYDEVTKTTFVSINLVEKT